MTKSEYQLYANLLIKSRKGSMSSFRKLYEMTVAVQHYQLHLFLDREEDIQDALQEVYFLLYQNLDKINPPRVFLAYLNRLTFYVGKNFVKLQTRKTHYVSTMDMTENWTYSEKDNPLFQVIEDDKVRLTRKAVEDLPPQERSVIFMRYFQKMKLKEVAFSMNLSLATVKRLQQSAHKNLKVSLEKQGIVAWGLIIAQSFGAPELKLSSVSKLKGHLSSAVQGTAVKTGLAAAGMTGAVCAGAITGGAPSFLSADVNLNDTLSRASIRIEAKAPVPIEEVIVQGGDNSVLPVSRDNDGAYAAEADYNGSYRITLRATNGKTDHTLVTVTGLDEESPDVLDIRAEEGRLTVFFEDKGSGIDFEALYYEFGDGRKVTPVSVDEAGNRAVFDLPGQYCILHYQDRAGNMSQTPVNLKNDA